MSRITQSLILVSLAMAGNEAIAAPNDTEAYYLCAHKITDNTSWNFGTAPAYCDIEPFGDPEFVRTYLAEIAFNTAQPTGDERARYMNALNATIRDGAAYYLSVRKPDASAAEEEAWVEAIKAVANQETFWSHYRDAVVDGRMKMMRGDSGHGHGMMQVDDRWHFARINEGKGWQIFENMLYAMEIFYSEWQNAAQASCLSAPDNWSERTRAAYAAYNGGPSRICRWHDNPVWQDEGFLGKFQAKSWLNYIANLDATAPVDVACMLEGVEFCVPEYVPPAHSIDNPETPWQYNYLELTSGEICLLENGGFHCVLQQQDAPCLNAMFDRVSIAQAIKLDQTQSDAYPKTVYEKHQCLANLENSFAVGQSVVAEKATNIRHTAAGTDTQHDAVVGKVYQILDVVAGTPADQSRYYRIRYATDAEGYIYAGGVRDFSSWATAASHESLPDSDKLIAMTGDTLYVVNAQGIPVKDAAGEQGAQIGKFEKGDALEVHSTQSMGEHNEIYYEVSTTALRGFIYSGSLLPSSDLASWTSFEAPEPETPPTPEPPVTEPPAQQDSGGGSLSYALLLLLYVVRKRRL
ncbi:hypothetical protein KJY73_05510 [Bowmanella sp. Y26]|uniref:hypothetical protein n=1 Tax=Bowmanella yangjiangensis TaxID=2811230 RepID=UPI001BDC9201|nr:hypothetical protein [Bowmanella yangjiangensis]MBT1063022.1 hypothetical protein [Bowmanella yangjiangensis]